MIVDSNLELLADPGVPFLFFTGKGGVGKTSLSCATAIHLADKRKRVLLVSTDPASNLDEVLATSLDREPRPVNGVPGLEALNINPEAAAAAYREKLIGPLRGQLPEAALVSMEEQLSGACTVEIAAFDEFSSLLGDPAQTRDYDHVIFDTAPTGHTLRLLALPGAWKGFLDENTTGTSCLGPLAGLEKQRQWYEKALEALSSPGQTRLILVSRPDRAPLTEAARASRELSDLGVSNQCLVLNGIFISSGHGDSVAEALLRRQTSALDQFASFISSLPSIRIPLRHHSLVGTSNLRQLFLPVSNAEVSPPTFRQLDEFPPLSELVDQLAENPKGVIMTMGKGGVGKTTLACSLAINLAERGLPVRLTTTDPAAHLTATLDNEVENLRVERIDPAAVTESYVNDVVTTQGADLDDEGRALLEEDLRSPCTEEIAVFQAFARTVANAENEIVIIDTAPTGHTLLLLDAAESYHREVERQGHNTVSDAVVKLLPRLRDPEFTRVLLVALPEPTPVHEAMALEEDLERAGISPAAWIINQSFSEVETADATLRHRAELEFPLLEKVKQRHSGPTYLSAWQPEEPVGRQALASLMQEPSFS